ncbi:unnamed protein product [Chilo suppressalis]|uniref:Major facilitator superfamily (MFS) profile domain-containing protein n=1 Tax=Chilo suppressalis TaxID=168631 RepID=A0ABN8BAK7_CHISP|nr:unnamed protein product [Chilo suppressalis]
MQQVRPDIVLTDRLKRQAALIDITIPHDENLVKAEKDKLSKYLDLAHEVTALWDVDSTFIVAIVVSVNGLIAKSLDQHLKSLSLDGWVNGPMQKAALLDTARIVRRSLQCFVTSGVCLNVGGHGVAIGFAAILLPQLRQPGSLIPIDDSSGSWIASILGSALVAGNFIAPTLMANYGRRTANMVSIIPMIVGWVCVLTANSVASLLVARFLQGVSIGMGTTIGPVLIGEYTSPINRGAFLTVISLTIAIGVLIVHTLGSYLTWQWTALVCCFIAFINLIIVIYSPESPSWLTDQGRYEESKEVFRWLRGDREEAELKEMIEASTIMNESKFEAQISQTFMKKLTANVAYFNSTIRKKEFYKPIFIMVHIYTLGQWAGASIITSYTKDIFENIVGTETNIAAMIIALDTQRIISNAAALIVIKKIKRRTMLFATVGINIIAFLVIAAYVYWKTRGMLPFDHPFIGIILIHIHMFSIATGTVPLPFIIAGELFPLEYRSLAGGISVLFLSSNLFITIKTLPLFLSTIGLPGAYVLYAIVVGYCLIVAGIFLPETKDRTLQDIEDEFRGRPLYPDEIKSVQSLTSLNLYNMDRRCSAPVL